MGFNEVKNLSYFDDLNVIFGFIFDVIIILIIFLF